MIISVTLFPVLLVSSPDHIGHLGDPSCLSEWRLKGAAVFATVLAVLTARRASETEKDVRLRIFKALAVHIATVKFTGRSSWSGAQVGNFVRTVMRDRYHMTYGAVLGETKFKTYYTDFCKRGGKKGGKKSVASEATIVAALLADGRPTLPTTFLFLNNEQMSDLTHLYRVSAQRGKTPYGRKVLKLLKKWREGHKKKPAAGQGKNGANVRDDSSSSSFFFSTYEYEYRD